MRPHKVALLAGLALLVGACQASGGGSEAEAPTSVPQPVPSSTSPTAPSSTSTTDTSLPSTSTTAPETTPVLLVWVRGPVPDQLVEGVAALPAIDDSTEVRSGLLHLADPSDDSLWIPVETMAFEPGFYPDLHPGEEDDAIADLGDGQVAVGTTAARIRDVGVGDTVRLQDGAILEVGAVVDDEAIGGAEIATTVDHGESLGLDTIRYLLAEYEGERSEVESAIRSQAPEDTGVRIRAPGETPILRHADAVLPQADIKEVFGEFAYRPTGSGGFQIDQEWVDENIVTAEIPLLGKLRCHHRLVSQLAGAMEELTERGLDSLIERSQGCYNPRFIAGSDTISRHAWGAAVDINIGMGPEAAEAMQDPELLEVMESWGFTSGHDWLLPDPGHFEYYGPPG